MEIRDEGYISGIILMVMCGVAILLNSAVLCSLFSNRRRIPPYMKIVTHLALSDLLLALVGFTMRGPGMIYKDFFTSNIAGGVTCKVMMLAIDPIIVSIMNCVLLLTFNRYSAITQPLRYSSRMSYNKMFANRSILVSWCIVVFVVATYGVFVLTGIGGKDYDDKFGRCSITSKETGKTAHFVMRMIFLVIPSFLTLGLYGCIIRSLIRHRQKNKEYCGVNWTSFLTISILLVLYYISYLPSLLLRDLPARFGQTWLSKQLSIATSLMFYISTITDPIVYAIRSPHIFQGLKQAIGMQVDKSLTAVVNLGAKPRVLSSAENSLSGVYNYSREGLSTGISTSIGLSREKLNNSLCISKSKEAVCGVSREYEGEVSREEACRVIEERAESNGDEVSCVGEGEEGISMSVIRNEAAKATP